MPWLCLCKAINKDDAAECATCHKPPILAPVKEHRAAAPAAQTFDQFCAEDLEKTILPAYKAQFEDPKKTADMRLHVARALLFARALRGFYDQTQRTAADAAAAGDLAVRFAVSLHQFGKLWKVKERVIRIDDSAEQPALLAVKPAREWKTASQSWAATYLAAIGLAKEKADPIAVLVGNKPPVDDVNSAIVRDAYLLERMRKDGAFDKTALNSFIKEETHKDALALLLADAKALIDDSKAAATGAGWKKEWDDGGSCMRLLADLVRAKSPDRSHPKFLHQHALRDEPVVDHLGNFGALAELAAGSGGALTAAPTREPEQMKPMIDFASQKLGKTIQCSFFPEPKVFCLGWDSGAVLEKRGAKYFLKKIYVHDKIPRQPVYLPDKSLATAAEAPAIIPTAKHKCGMHRGVDCGWLVYDMAAKDLEISRLLTVSVSACSVAVVWDHAASKILLSHINDAPPIPVGLMAHLEKLPVGGQALRMLGSFYGSGSEKKKFTTDLPYKELPFSRVLFSRSTAAFEALEQPPALTHPVTGLDFTGAAPAWMGEYGVTDLGGIAGGLKILLGQLPEYEPLRAQLIYYLQTPGEIKDKIRNLTTKINTKPVDEEKKKGWLAEIDELNAQKEVVGKTPAPLAASILEMKKKLEEGTFGFAPVWKSLFTAVRTKDTATPLLTKDFTQLGDCLRSFMALKGLEEPDEAKKRAAMLLFLYLQAGRPIELNNTLVQAFLSHFLKYSIPLTEATFAKLVAAVPKLA